MPAFWRTPKSKPGSWNWAAPPLGGSPAEFGTIISEATEKWAKVIKFAGIKTE